MLQNKPQIVSIEDFVNTLTPAVADPSTLVASRAVWQRFSKACERFDAALPKQVYWFPQGDTGVAMFATQRDKDDSTQYLDILGAGFSTEFVLPCTQGQYEQSLLDAAGYVASIKEDTLLGSDFYREVSPDYIGFRQWSDSDKSNGSKIATPTAHFRTITSQEEYLNSLSSSRRYKVRRALKEPYHYTLDRSYCGEQLEFGVKCCVDHWGDDPILRVYAIHQVLWTWALHQEGYPIFVSTVSKVPYDGIMSVATHSVRGSRLVLESFTSDRSYRVGNFNLAKTILACVENLAGLESIHEYDPGVNINFSPGESYYQYKTDVCNSEARQYELYYAISTPHHQTKEEFVEDYFGEGLPFPPYAFDGTWVK